MTTRILRTASILLCISCSSCDKRERENSTETDKVPTKHASEFPRQNKARNATTNNSIETSEASLRKALKSHNRGTLQVKQFKSDLLALAKMKEVDPMGIAAQMILEGQSPDDQLARMLWVIDAFSDPATQVDLAKQLPAGTIRKLVVSSATRELEKKKDIAGLKSAYAALPVGSDRTNLSVALSKMKIHEEGLLNGLEFINQLEMPEERYAAIMETKDAWAAQIRDPQTQTKLDQVVNTMEGQLKENLFLLISGLKR